MDVLVLSETQNEAFDTDYHSSDELAAKIDAVRSRFGDRPARILDLGGGNGRFLDSLLAALPNARGTLIDISADLLARNIDHPRKEMINGSIADLSDFLAGQTFDIITLNWVLHHLVGRSYQVCRRNVVECLAACSDLLAPGGVIIVTDNMFDGFFGLNLPSHVIFAITRVRWAPFARLASAFFNTAGVGVCFQSRHAWRRLFAQSGLSPSEEQPGENWPMTWRRKLAFSFLALQHVSHLHFYLVPGRS
jgi:SAM-dependent methyltransferase